MGLFFFFINVFVLYVCLKIGSSIGKYIGTFSILYSILPINTIQYKQLWLWFMLWLFTFLLVILVLSIHDCDCLQTDLDPFRSITYYLFFKIINHNTHVIYEIHLHIDLDPFSSLHIDLDPFSSYTFLLVIHVYV